MRRIYSNGPERDYVRNPLDALIRRSAHLQFAAPFFNEPAPVLAAAEAGKSVLLLIGLNAATAPDAVKRVLSAPNVTVRYLTDNFHAKIYIGEGAALVGSANLTHAGLGGNREAAILLDRPEDQDAIEELRRVYAGLWDSAKSLTPTVAAQFEATWRGTRLPGKTRDEIIAEAVGPAAAHTIAVGSGQKSRQRIFLDGLQRKIGEQYGKAFAEITALLGQHGYRRPELADVGQANETNRFLNWVRLTEAVGDGWSTAPLRDAAGRRQEVLRLGAAWATTDRNMVPDVYLDWLAEVADVFGDRDRLAAASKSDLTRGLQSLHAFAAQNRHVSGGDVAGYFWLRNEDKVSRVRASFLHLLYGPGDVAERLHDFLYDEAYVLSRIGIFTALELCGTVRPAECPPVNSRIAKGLRYLGYDVPTS